MEQSTELNITRAEGLACLATINRRSAGHQEQHESIWWDWSPNEALVRSALDKLGLWQAPLDNNCFSVAREGGAEEEIKLALCMAATIAGVI